MIKTFTTTVFDFNEDQHDLIVEFDTENPEAFEYWKADFEGQKRTERSVNLGAYVNDNVRREILKHCNEKNLQIPA